MNNPHDNTYATMLRHILANGDSHADRTGVGTTSVFGYQCRYDLGHGFPALTTKRMAWHSIVVELAWFLLGRTDNQWLVDRKCTIWNEWATAEKCGSFGRAAGDLGPVYGRQWRNFGAEEDVDHRTQLDIDHQGVDQIKALCKDLASNPGSRRMIVTGWNPAEISGVAGVALPPCHTLWQCKVRTKRVGPELETKDCETPHTERYLDLHLYQRSADAFLGVPFNIASYALLTHLLALTHDMQPGHFIHTFGDLHVYNNHRAQVDEQLAREPFETPTLDLDPSLRGRGFDGLMVWAAEVERFALQGTITPTTPQTPAQLLDYVCHKSIKADVAV